jgi:hypothetical protein
VRKRIGVLEVVASDFKGFSLSVFRPKSTDDCCDYSTYRRFFGNFKIDYAAWCNAAFSSTVTGPPLITPLLVTSLFSPFTTSYFILDMTAVSPSKSLGYLNLCP